MKKKISKKRKISILLLLSLLFLGIGFSSVSTNLYITGTANITNADFDVIFTQVVLNGTDITSTAISSNGKELSFTANNMLVSNDTSILEFQIKNDATMYDANTAVSCIAIGENANYYTISSVIDGFPSTTIESKNTKEGTTEIKLNQNPTNTTTKNFYCAISSLPIERTTIGEEPTT